MQVSSLKKVGESGLKRAATSSYDQEDKEEGKQTSQLSKYVFLLKDNVKMLLENQILFACELC